MFTTSTGSYYARYDALGNEYKRISLGLSEACMNAALLKIAQNYNYAPPVGGDLVMVGSDTCYITSVTYGTEDPITHRKLATVKTTSQYPNFGGAWSNSQVQATILNPTYSVTQSLPAPLLPPPPVSIDSWDEVISAP